MIYYHFYGDWDRLASSEVSGEKIALVKLF
jgi:hypothetical protein